MVAPFIATYLLNWIIFIIIITTLAKKNWTSIVKTKDSSQQGISGQQQFMIAVALSVLFGLGWGIGLFVSGDIHEIPVTKNILSVLFVLLTSFHGLFVFIMHGIRSKDIRKKWKAVFNTMSCKQATHSSTTLKFDYVKKTLGASGSTGTSYASSTLTHSVGKGPPSFEMESIHISTLKDEGEMAAAKVELQVDFQDQDKSDNPTFGKQEPDSLKKEGLAKVCFVSDIPTVMEGDDHDEMEVAQKESLSVTFDTKVASIPSQDEVYVCEKIS